MPHRVSRLRNERDHVAGVPPVVSCGLHSVRKSRSKDSIGASGNNAQLHNRLALLEISGYQLCKLSDTAQNTGTDHHHAVLSHLLLRQQVSSELSTAYPRTYMATPTDLTAGDPT